MPEPTKEDSSFKRKLSKREKKQLKKQGRADRCHAMQCVMMVLLDVTPSYKMNCSRFCHLSLSKLSKHVLNSMS